MPSEKFCRWILTVCVTLCLTGCACQPRTLVAEPLDKHDLTQDRVYCEEFARKFGVINMEPVMADSSMAEFPDQQRQVQLYEACMLKKGYRF